MSKEKPGTKDETFWAVLNAAIELEFRKGHLKWTMTELSRKSKVTRSLIYYYFGRSKMDILNDAVKMIGEFFIGIDSKRDKMWDEGRFAESLKVARRFYDKTPYLGAFYLANVGKPNDIGRQLKSLENSFIRRLKKRFPKASKAEVNTLYSIYFGMGFSPIVTDAEIDVFAVFVGKIAKTLKPMKL